MKPIATWIRKCDEAHFARVFRQYPELCLHNARNSDIPWNDIRGLLLTGGSDISHTFLKQPCSDPLLIQDPDPARDLWDFAATSRALESGLPLLAICRGLQVLNVTLGGTLHLHIPGHDNAKYENIQELRHAHGLNHVFPAVNSSHHQALSTLGSGLVVEAWCAEDDIIERARLKDHPFALGLQYHPERDPLYQSLFQDFVDHVQTGHP